MLKNLVGMVKKLSGGVLITVVLIMFWGLYWGSPFSNLQ